MLISNNHSSVDFSVLGYQFAETANFYDANWLNVKLVYTSKTGTAEYIDPCILTTELSDTVCHIEKLLTGETSGFISCYTEPNLIIEIKTETDSYNFRLHFNGYSAEGEHKVIDVSETIDTVKLLDINNEFKGYLSKFPQRRRFQHDRT
ncbi:MAG: hypothetical protein NC122_03090 [Faecalibacterium sp.]|nr:hypothetical protein [Ruminococcus sp.]MCM1392480.1 hypothetical protein [Ruminococcus sp.]MCM1485171.1 hypothetical protein [Faecalibacterium sp.]